MAGKDTKEKIKEIGLSLFRKHGFENVTINEICEKSGVNKHTFYYYMEYYGMNKYHRLRQKV